MKIIKKEDYILFKNSDGEYHMSIDKYESMENGEAERFALKEIELKKSSSYSSKTITFKQARLLGFCEYGIKDFCKQLELDIDGTYSIDELNKRLTLDVLTEYTYECIKLFGKNTLKYLGGVEGVLSEDTIELVLRSEFIPEKTLHILSTKFAYMHLDKFEKEYPDDKRPRKAIEAKEAWIKGDLTNEQLSAAASAASAAAWSAVSAASFAAASAAWSAAARSAARSAASFAASAAARSADARSAARSAAARSAARSAAARFASAAAAYATKNKQVEIIKEALKEVEK